MGRITVDLKVPAYYLWLAIFLGLVLFGLSVLVGFTWLWALLPVAIVYSLLVFMYTTLALAALFYKQR